MFISLYESNLFSSVYLLNILSPLQSMINIDKFLAIEINKIARKLSMSIVNWYGCLHFEIDFELA